MINKEPRFFLTGLDGWRAVSILLVIFSHLASQQNEGLFFQLGEFLTRLKIVHHSFGRVWFLLDTSGWSLYTAHIWSLCIQEYFYIVMILITSIFSFFIIEKPMIKIGRKYVQRRF